MTQEQKKHAFLIRGMAMETKTALKVQSAKEDTTMTDYILDILNENLADMGYSECRKLIPKTRI